MNYLFLYVLDKQTFLIIFYYLFTRNDVHFFLKYLTFLKIFSKNSFHKHSNELLMNQFTV
jgi:hypothetical protein